MPPFVTADQLRRALAADAARKPDIVKATYVGPDGARGKHIVKLNCSEREIAVSGPPHQTFKPGTSVLLASHQNGQHRTMLAYPVGARGASQYQAATQRRQASVLGNYGNTCPVQITGHDYLGVIYDDQGATQERLRMRQFSDGTVGSWIGGDWVDWPYAIGFNPPSFGFGARSEQYVALTTFSASGAFVIWDYIGATIYTVDTPENVIAGPVYAGGYFWVLTSDGSTGQLYRLDPSDSGSLTAIGNATTMNTGPLWAVSGSQIYTVDLIGDGLLLRQDGSEAGVWTTVGANVLTLSQGSSTTTEVGIDGRLLSVYDYPAGQLRMVRPSLPTEGEVTLTPSHWVIPFAIQCSPGGDDVICHDPIGATFTRLSATRDYSSVAAECALPQTAIDVDPVSGNPPRWFFPSN